MISSLYDRSVEELDLDEGCSLNVDEIEFWNGESDCMNVVAWKSMNESEASIVASNVSIVDEIMEEFSLEAISVEDSTKVDSSEVVENGTEDGSKEAIKLDDSTSEVSVVIDSKVVSKTDLVNSVDNDSNNVDSTADVDDT